MVKLIAVIALAFTVCTQPSETAGSDVLISIGMSSSQNIWCGKFTCETTPTASNSFMAKASSLNPSVRVINGADGGAIMEDWLTPSSPEYTRIDQVLARAGTSPSSVKYAWVGHGIYGNISDPASYAAMLRQATDAMRVRYPNLKVIVFSGQNYLGYSSSSVATEPKGANSWVGIDQFLATASYPGVTLLRGPYWHDPATARSYYAPDGHHPSDLGRGVWAQMLVDFFKLQPWFLGGTPPAPTLTACERVATYSDGSKTVTPRPLAECA